MSVVITASPEETIEMSARLAGYLDKGDLIALVGGLGAGKTVFVKGLAKGLGVPEHLYVNSPSFVIMKEYMGDKPLYHFDVYRLDHDLFCDTVDFGKYFYDSGVTAVEWADKIRDILPESYLEVAIELLDAYRRKFVFRASGERMQKVMDRMEHENTGL